MPPLSKEARVLRIIETLDSLHLNLAGDPHSSKFWITFELFQELNKGNPDATPQRMRDSVVHGLVKDIAILKRNLDIETGNLPSETESNLIAEIGKREQTILDLNIKLDDAQGDVIALRDEINRLNGVD